MLYINLFALRSQKHSTSQWLWLCFSLICIH